MIGLKMSRLILNRAVWSTLKELLLRAKDKKSKDFLLDKYTLRYIKYVDIEAAL